MASERQIAANRQNAQKSRGPRSTAGRKRASRNSYRHGLAATIPSTAERARRVERLARKIAGNPSNLVVLEYARAAAQAEFDLAQVRRVKVATIEQVLAFGQFAAANASLTTPTMLATEPERTAEAVRRSLPQLLKLQRYERRAAARRQRALRAINDVRNL